MNYRFHFFCCTNVRPPNHPEGSCGRQNATELRGYFKKRVSDLGLQGVRINAAGCLDQCKLGPAMVVYPEGVWYTYRSEADIDEILETHIRGGNVVQRLLMRT
jgi:(2Fe-2S) ferredoxin